MRNVTEKQLLAKLFMTPFVINEIDAMEEADFWDEHNWIIYKTLCDMFDRDKDVSHGDIAIKLKGDYVERIKDIIGHLTDATAETLTDAAKNEARLRELEREAMVMLDHVKDGMRADYVAERAMNSISKISNNKRRTTRYMRDVVSDTYAIISNPDKNDMVIPTGIETLDRAFGGFSRGVPTVIGARPSVGKTAFLLNIMANIALSGKHAYFSTLEDTEFYVACRIMSRFAKVNYMTLAHCKGLAFDEHKRIQHFANTKDYILDRIHVDDSTGQTTGSIRREAMRLKSKGELDIIFVDHLGELTNFGDTLNSTSSNITALRDLAKDLDVPVVVLSQLNRRSVNENRDPNPADLRDSGTIEQVARNIWMLKRDVMADGDESNELKVIVCKATHGKTGAFYLETNLKYMWIGDKNNDGY